MKITARGDEKSHYKLLCLRKSRSKARELCEKQHVYWLCLASLLYPASLDFRFVSHDPARRLELM